MPNWCSNKVRITGPKSVLALLHESAKTGNLFNTVKPMPLGLRITTSGYPKDPRAESNLKEYGYETWYDFAVAEWGTKWDADCTVEDYSGPEPQGFLDDPEWTLTLSYDTAWAPPLPIYEKLVELGLDVHATYSELGMDFAGVWRNGEDICFDNITKRDEEFWNSDHGDQLDTDFQIRDTLAEWAEDK